MTASTPASAALRRFAGAGGTPHPRNIVLITARLLVRTDMSVGDGTDTLTADAAVARDPRTGRPAIPAPTQSGALRAHLTRLRAVTGDDVDLLFGSPGQPARLRPVSAVAHPPAPPTAVRPGIAVDPATGLVYRGHLFTSEVVTAATTFALQWELHIPPDPTAAARVVQLAATAAAALAAGAIRFGQHSHAGRGEVSADTWSARLFDLCGQLTDRRDWHTCAPDERHTLTPTAEPTTDPITALNSALPDQYSRVHVPDLSRRDVLALTVELHNGELLDDMWTASPLLLGDRASSDNTITYLQRPVRDTRDTVTDQPFDSGMATLNLLRRIAIRALRWMTQSSTQQWAIAAPLVRDLFGSHPAVDTDGTVSAARLRVDEGPIHDGADIALTSVSINDLAHTTVQGALVTRHALYGGQRTLRIEVHDPVDTDLGLLLLVLADLVDGAAPAVGADTASGNGRRHATEIHGSYHRTGEPVRTWDSWDEMRSDAHVRDSHARLRKALADAEH